MLGFGAGWQVGRLRNLGAAQAGAALGALLGASIGLVAGVVAVAALTNAMVTGSVAIAAAAELLARRWLRSPVWNVGPTTALIVALATWMLGRGDSPLCVARSWAQPHAALACVVGIGAAVVGRTGLRRRPSAAFERRVVIKARRRVVESVDRALGTVPR